MFYTELTMQSIKLVDLGLELESETNLLAKCLIGMQELLLQDILLVGKVGIELPQMLDLSEYCIVLDLIELLIFLDNLLLLLYLALQLRYLPHLIPLHLSHKTFICSICTVLQHHRIYRP